MNMYRKEEPKFKKENFDTCTSIMRLHFSHLEDTIVGYLIENYRPLNRTPSIDDGGEEIIHNLVMI